MGWRDTWYPYAVAAMIQLRGESAPDAFGNRLPVTRALDTIAIMGQVSAPLVRAIEKFMTGENGLPSKAIAAKHVDSDGTFILDSPLGAATAIRDGISIADYVAGYGAPNAAHLRSVEPEPDATRYTIWLVDGLSNEDGLLGFCRQALADWQATVNASSAAIVANALNLETPMSKVDNAAFWGALRRLCTDLDVIAENPPERTLDKMKGALSDALDKSAEFAGQSAAKLSQKAGEIAGNFGKGFFETAGVTSLVVAGIAVWLFIK